jgi:hypothetical protein
VQWDGRLVAACSDLHGTAGHAFEGLWTAILAVEAALDAVRGRSTDHQGIGRGEPLQAGGDIGCRADGVLFLLRPTLISPTTA